MIRKFVILALLSLPALGQILDFKDVKIYLRKSPNDKPKKEEGILSLDRSGGALAFIKEKKLLRAIPYDKITGLVYRTKGDKLLVVQYKDSSGQGQFVEFELTGGNRDNIVLSLETQSGVKVTRTTEK